MKEKKEDIISKLLINNYDKYYHIAYSYAQNKNDAQDIVQEGAYKAIYNSKKLRQVKYADTWICKIIINEAIKYIKKNRFNWDRDIVNEMKDEKDVFEIEDNKIELKQALNKLTDKERAVIVLRYFEEMSLNDVAYILGENLSTVKSRIYRALEKLKEYMIVK